MKKGLSLFLLATLILSISGCAAKTKTEESDKNEQLQTIVFASPVALESFGNCALYAADYLGYFKEEGLEIKFEEGIGTTDVKMVASGQAQFAYPSPGVILTSKEAGVDVIAVFSHQPVNIFGFAYAKGHINGFADLKGKSIALGDASWKSIGAPIIKAAGLDPEKDVEWVTVGDARYQSTASGQTDALLSWDVEYGQLIGMGFDFDYLDADEVLPQLSNSVIVSSAYAKDNPDIVKKFNRALAKGQYFTYKNPAATADITLRKYPNIKIDYDGGVLAVSHQVYSYFGNTEEEQKETLEVIGRFNEQRWQVTIDAAINSGIITTPYKAADIFTNDFIDNSWERSKVEADAVNYTFGSDAYNKSKQ